MARNGPLLLILVLALALRAAVAIWLPSVAHPDETFQYIEQAYRLATGRGVVPWEYVLGSRSWIIPGLLWPIAALSHWLSPAPSLYLGGVAALMVAVSTTGVWAAWVIGKACGGPRHAAASAVLAAFLTAVWPEILLFAPHVLGDTLSGASLIAGLACAAPRGPAGRGRVLAAGLLLGLTVALRIQLGPAVALAAAWLALTRFRGALVPFGVALAAPVLVSGLVDWATWGVPFQSTLVNVRANAGGVADSFSIDPWYWYLGVEVAGWGVPVAVLVLVTALLGARRAPLPAAVFVVVVATFSAVAHKEYRFLYPALPLLACLCGLGTAALVEEARRLSSRAKPQGLALAVAVAVWLVACAWVGASAPMRPLWTRDRAVLQALDAVNKDPKSCGLAVAPPNAWGSVSLARLRADLELYAAPTDDAWSDPQAYDYVLAPWEQDADDAPDGFDLVRCYAKGETCLYHRPGACSPAGGHFLIPGNQASVERALARIGAKPAARLDKNPHAWRPPQQR